MKRRTFMQVTAGLLAYPVLPAIYERGIPEWVVKECCDEEYPDGLGRYAMTLPFIQEAQGFATDGRIGLRLDNAEKFASENAIGKLPPIAPLFAEYKWGGPWKPWKGDYQRIDDGYYTDPACLNCFGRGVIGDWTWCKTCNGDGFEWTMEYRDNSFVQRDWGSEGELMFCYECRHCHDGRFGKRCGACNGSGHDKGSPQIVSLDGRIVSRKYFHLAHNLPGVEFIQESSKDTPIRFRFDGGIGLLMPMEPRCKKN